MADKKKLSEMDDEESAAPTLENVENIPTSVDQTAIPEAPPYDTTDEIEKEIADLSAPSSDEIKTPTEEAPAPAEQPSSPNYQDLLDRYKAAQASRQSGMQGAQIMRAADIAATGLAGHGAHRAPEDLFKGMETQAELPVQNVQEEIKARPEIQKTYTTEALSDSKSDVSKLFRDTLQKIYKSSGLDITVPETLSASQVHDSMPNILHYMSSREIAAARKAAAQASLEGKQEKADAKEEDKITKMNTDLAKAINASNSRGTIVGFKKRIAAGESAATLYNATNGNPNNINMRELATSVANILQAGGNQTSVNQINELVPHTMVGNINQIKQWLTNNPTGTGQQRFAKMYLDIAKRETDLAKNQLLREQFTLANSYGHKLREVAPDEYYKTLGATINMSPDEIKEVEAHPNFKGQYIESDKKKDKKIQTFANKTFGGDYEKAKSVMIDRGYKPQEQ